VTAYVLFGGIKGVMYTDAFQGTLMLVGMLVLTMPVYSQLGGVAPAHQQLTELSANPAVFKHISGSQAGGFADSVIVMFLATLETTKNRKVWAARAKSVFPTNNIFSFFDSLKLG